MSVSANPALAVMLLIVAAELPLLLSVMVCAALAIFTVWLLNIRLEGTSEMVGNWPVPVKLTVCGLLGALSVMVRLAVCVPPAEGVKVTLTVQFAPAAKLSGHVVVV